MSIEKIGENAGNIWKILKENGQMSSSALKKTVRLSEKDINMGLGWLARENKLSFEQKGNQTLISLTE
jgi:predicted HTH transcriptional regulator